jgi:hypothetical protein
VCVLLHSRQSPAAGEMLVEGDYVVKLGSSVTANLQPELVVHTELSRLNRSSACRAVAAVECCCCC